MNRLVRVLSTEKATFARRVRLSAFCAGFTWSIGPPHNLLETPISTTLAGSIGGCMAIFGAYCVCEFMPPQGIPFFVAALSGSAAVHGSTNAYVSYRKMSNKLSTK